MDNIVLGVEVGNGKYLVFTQEDQNTRLFVAFNQIGIGGHKEMSERLDMLTYGKKIEQEDLQKFGRRPEIIMVFNEAINVSERLPQLDFADSRNYKGGLYEFESRTLRLHGSSAYFGAPSLEVLRELEESLEWYFYSQGNSVKKVELGT